MRQIERFKQLLARSSLTPVTFVSATETRLDGWESGGRPERVRSLDLACRCPDGGAALMLYDEPDHVPFDLFESLAMLTAASLEPNSVAPTAVTRRVVRVVVDDITYEARAAVRGPFAVMLVDGVEGIPQLGIARRGGPCRLDPTYEG